MESPNRRSSPLKSPSPGKKYKFLSRAAQQSTASSPNSKKFGSPIFLKNTFNTIEETRISHGKNVYQIGTEIGRGAFGVVFQAFNVDTGDFVAVKRFPIKSIDDDQLAAIEGEIELMRRLNHPNIVQYISTIRSKNFLYIVLEYMENGSLATVIKKFGAFSESLTAIYVSQILRGLSYLHEQGVLHRDIKGANILTTKDGQVKLADFGVAVRLSEGSMDGQEVVGSPYWIAPEVIEMNTPTSACDIWSVGCLVIELLSGRPPYHDFAPLAAMFHIVQDDCPPFPKGISDTVRDFLLLCFNKDPALRPSARVLQSHPWLQNPSSVSNIPESELEESVSGLESSVANTVRMFRKIAISSPGTISSIENASNSKPENQILSSRNTNAWVSTDFPSPVFPVKPNLKNFPDDSPMNINGGFFDFPDHQISTIQSDERHNSNQLSRPPTSKESPYHKRTPSNGQQPGIVEIDRAALFLDLNDTPKSQNKMSLSVPKIDLTGGPFSDTSGGVRSPSNLLSPAAADIEKNSVPFDFQFSENDIGDNVDSSRTADSAELQASNNIFELDSYDEDHRLFSPDDTDTPGVPRELQSKRTIKGRGHSNGRPRGEKGFFFKATASPRHKSRVIIPKTTPFISPKHTSPVPRHESRGRSVGYSTPSDPSKSRVRDNSSSKSSRDGSTGKSDSDLRDAKELFRVIVNMKPNTPEKNLAVLCQQLSSQIENSPELAINLINMYGVSTLLDLMEVREVGTGVIITTLRSPILLLVNKIIENNSKAHEIVVALGTLPKIIRTLENACVNELKLSVYAPLTVTSDTITASLGALWSSAFSAPAPALDPLVLESAKFVSLTASSSQEIVNGLVTAGGLQAIVDMISMGSLIIRPNPMKILMGSPNALPVHRITTRGIDIFRCRTNSGEKIMFQIENSSKQTSHPFRFSYSTDSSEQSLFTSSTQVLEDVKAVTYYGIDSILSICRAPSSLKKEYCKLFYKYGLLFHLSGALFNVLLLYHRAYVDALISSSRETAHSIASATTNETDKSSTDQSPRIDEKDNEADKSQECKYAFAIVNIVYNYSRFDVSISEMLSKSELGSLLWIVLIFLSSPDLRSPPLSVVSQSVNSSGSTFSYLDAPGYPSPSPLRPDSKEPDTDMSLFSVSGMFDSVTGRRKSLDQPIASNLLTTYPVYLSKTYLEIALLMLRTLKNLSSEPTTLFNLEKAGTIPVLVPLLYGPLNEKCKNQVIACIYNMCRVNKRRQEQAALHGIVPYLQHVITDGKDNRTRQYALPLLCSLAHASAASRSELLKCDGVKFFLGLLKENFWQTYAFNALVTWMSHDPDHVYVVLIEKDNSALLVEFFCLATHQVFRSIHQPLVDMMLKSPTLCRTLSTSGLFVQSILKRLNAPEAIVLCSLLRVIQLLHQCTIDPGQFVIDYDLIDVVKKFTVSDSQVLVYQMATKLLADFQMSSAR